MAVIPAGHRIAWGSAGTVESQAYQCGHCGNRIASDSGWVGTSTYDGKAAGWVCICHECSHATYIDNDRRQFPGAPVGNEVEGLDDPGVAELYREARRAAAANAYTASALCCRKLLMHIAVDKGAKPNEAFVTYVKFLADNHYIPPGSEGWVDHIRSKSNEANHEIVVMTRGDAEELLKFTEMLLRVIYEFPASIKAKTPAPEETA